MTIPRSNPARWRPAAATIVFLAFAPLLVLVGFGCKPASSAGDSTAPPLSSQSGQPSAEDARNFVQTLPPPALRLTDFKADAPVRQPGTAPDGKAWIISVKATFTPAENLLAPASLEQDRAFYAPRNDLEDLQAWRNTYVRSLYARTYGAFDLPILPPPAHLLVVQQPQGKPLATIYGKIAAEWQVDHWRFSNVDLQPPSSLGRPHALFTDEGPTLVLGSPEAEAMTKAHQGLDEFRRQRAAAEERFAKDLAAATRPGTTYRGQIKHPGGVLPCEVRFVETKGNEAQAATFEVRVPQDPAYLYIYQAKLAPKIPLNIAPGAAYRPASPAAASNADTDVPVGDLNVRFVRGTGKTASFGNWPGVLLSGAMRRSYSETPFVLLGGHLQGVLGDFNGDYALSADLVR